jgi:hypothetical protein
MVITGTRRGISDLAELGRVSDLKTGVAQGFQA